MLTALLLTSLALADCEAPPLGITYVWPEEQQEVGTDVWVTLAGDLTPMPEVALYANKGDITVPLTAVRQVNCTIWVYDCAAQFRPIEPLAADKTWEVKVDGWTVSTFATSPGPHPEAMQGPLTLRRGAITDDQPDPETSAEPTYQARWSASPTQSGEWLEYEYRGDEIRPGSGATPYSRVLLGSAYCDGGEHVGTLSTAEVRARRISVTGATGEWTEWTDVDPALTQVTRWDDSSSCSSAPRSLIWLGLPLLLLARRRR